LPESNGVTDIDIALLARQGIHFEVIPVPQIYIYVIPTITRTSFSVEHDASFLRNKFGCTMAATMYQPGLNEREHHHVILRNIDQYLMEINPLTC
jgi:hypothetical protein